MEIEQRTEPTPSGGVRLVAYYLSDDGLLTNKLSASTVRIIEYDTKGNVLRTTYMTKNKNQ